MPTIYVKHTSDIEFKDYDVTAGDTVFTAITTTKDASTLTDTGAIILDGDNTQIQTTFTGDFTLHPEYPFNMYGILELDVRGIGGNTWIKQISTVYNSNDFISPASQVWDGAVPLNKATIATFLAPDTVVVTAELDYTKLDFTINEYKLTARLGKIPAIISFCLTTEDGNDINVEALTGCLTTE